MEQLLREAEEAQQRTLHKLSNDAQQVARLKDPLLLLLDALAQTESIEGQRATLIVLRRLFDVCSAHFYDAQAFLEGPVEEQISSGLQVAVTRGNVVLKALLGALSALSAQNKVDEEVLLTLVEMLQELCAQSINTRDVVALFDFLRLGRPPPRKMVLQLLKTLMGTDTQPRAIFTMRGPHAGIILPADQPLFAKKGYSCSFGVQLNSNASYVPLYSFRGQSGQGVSAAIKGDMLLVKVHATQGLMQHVEVPFAEYRERMERTWVHLCVVHAKKMVFKDKVTVYVDGKSIFNGNLGYPDPVAMVGGQNSIGIEPLLEGLQGKLWSPTLFGASLTDAEVQKLHWLTHWKNDLNSVAAENAGLADKSKMCFSYDARSCDLQKRICYDVSGNDCHGSLGPGTSAYVTQSFVHALDSVGGCSCFLLLLLDQIPEMESFHPTHEFGMGEISDLLIFIGAGLRHSTCRSHFVRLQGVKVVEFILQSISPSYLSVDLLDGVISILEAMTDFLEKDEDVVEYIYRLLFLNTSWFLSPFDTQMKLLSEVLPKYLQLLQNAGVRERSRSIEAISHTNTSGWTGPSRALSSADFPQSISAKDQVDVRFFCRLIPQVYMPRGDKNIFTAERMDDSQLKQLREIIVNKLLDLLLFPLGSDNASGQWRELLAYIFQQCDLSLTSHSLDANENMDVDEILRYLTRNVVSIEPRKNASNTPTRQLQLITNMFKLSKGTVRILWKPMLSLNANVRLSALQLFEQYTSEKVLLHKTDMLMLYSAFQAHTITPAVAELLLDIIIGREKTIPKAHASAGVSGTRAGTFARMAYIPLILLGLIHRADFNIQARLLTEIRAQLASPTMGDSVKEAIRSWPSWMSRLRSLSIAASVATAKNVNTRAESNQENNSTQTQALNEACILLSAEDTPAIKKLEAIQTIATANDVAGCDFALSVLQNSKQNESISNAIIAMVINQFPHRCCALVRKLANQMIVDITVYCVLRVKNGWLHFLEFYFFHCRTPSDYCSLAAVVCEQVVDQARRKQSIQADIMWENLCQVAAVVSQSHLVATKMTKVLRITDAVLSPGQNCIIIRKAFELWQVILPQLDRINWDTMAAHLVQSADYGSDASEEKLAIFSNLVASRSRSKFLALNTTIQHVALAQASNTSGVQLIQQLYTTLGLLKLIAPLPSPPCSNGVSSPLSPLSSDTGSPPLSGSMLPDMTIAGIAESSMFFDTAHVSDAGTTPERDMVHTYTLDECLTLLKDSLKGSDVGSVRLIVKILVALANSALHLRSPSATPDLTKTLQIISSTDLSFFNEVDQFQELFTLWQLHVGEQQRFCDPDTIECHVQQSNADFIKRWMYVVEHHTMDFNPYLVHQYATSQAELLGEELQQCESLWKEIIDDNNVATTCDSSDAELEDESRLVELKHNTETFASSVHKLLSCSSKYEAAQQVVDLSNVQPNESTDVAIDGVVYKVTSRENGFRMRLRLKKVTEEYRIRNLSCEHLESSLTDTESKESGRRLSRRFRGSIEGCLVDLENSWRSDTGSDYSDFLVDAQMRAAIIRSLSNADEYGSGYDGYSDDDDLDSEDGDLINSQEDENLSLESPQLGVTEQEVEESVRFDSISQSSGVNTGSTKIQESATISKPSAIPVAADSTDVSSTSPPPSSPSLAALKTSSPLTAYSFGASVLTVVGGVAGYFQKSVKDAKDAVEYGVDTLYTAKDAVSEEAQALVQEVSTYMDTPERDATTSLSPNGTTLELTPSSLKLMESKLTSIAPSSNTLVDGPSALFSSSQSQTNEITQEKRPVGSSKSKTNLQVNAQLVRHLHVVEGKLILSQSSLRFVAERVIDEHETVVVEKKSGVHVDKVWRFLFKRRRWSIDDIANIYRRRYLLKPTALELFIRSTRKNYFFNLVLEDVQVFHEALMAHRPLLLKRDPTVRRLRHPSSLFRNSSMSHKWTQHEISTFEYLMWLNTIAGRTYNDLTQYPVFPWIISDYESATLDLTRRGAYRDLTKPIGALEPSRLNFFIDRYNAFEDPDIPKFMYGTHYSNIGSVLYYLIRLEPFTSYALSVQGGKFDHADRLFHSVAETWNNCLTDYTDLKELTPEWFYLPEFLVNCNKLDLGVRQNDAVVNDVVLPPWARSPEDFVLKNLVALESEYVSANIHHWIDLIFGWKQRGVAAVEANNVFFYLTYEGMVDVDSITDPIVKSSMQSQIAHFGQTPTQVLRDPHPQRQSLASIVSSNGFESKMAPTPLFPSSNVNCTLLSVPHETPVVMVSLIPGTSLLACLDINGMFSSHRYGPIPSKAPHHHQAQFLSDKSTSTSKYIKPKSAIPSSSTNEQPGEFIELQDRKNRKVLGEKRLLLDQRASNSMALIHNGMVLCSVGYHDFSARFHSTTDGTLLYRLLQHQSVVTCVSASNKATMLALGCTDGTISVWKIATISSTLLDSLKIFRGSKASARPVHASDYSADQVLLGHNARINCVSASDELGVCVSGSASNECLVHDLEDGSILHSFSILGDLEPGVVSLALSNVGHVVLQSMGTGAPMLYSYHLNGSLLARIALGGCPMASISISARYSKVIVSNSDRALVMTAHTLDEQRVLLEKDSFGEISAQGLAPDELHVVFGVGSGKIACVPLLQPELVLHRTEI